MGGEGKFVLVPLVFCFLQSKIMFQTKKMEGKEKDINTRICMYIISITNKTPHTHTRHLDRKIKKRYSVRFYIIIK